MRLDKGLARLCFLELGDSDNLLSPRRGIETCFEIGIPPAEPFETSSSSSDGWMRGDEGVRGKSMFSTATGVNVLLSFPSAHPHHKRHDAATLAMFCTSHAVERKPVRNTSWQQLSRQASWQQLSRQASWQQLCRQASWQELSAQASWQHLSRQAPWQQLSRQASWQQLSRHGAATLAMFCTPHAVN